MSTTKKCLYRKVVFFDEYIFMHLPEYLVELFCDILEAWEKEGIKYEKIKTRS